MPPEHQNQKPENKKRRIAGVVVSDKMQKTRVVAVSRLKKHPKYLKYYKVTTKFKAHDEANEYKTGDEVVIEETRPMSREKRWKIVGRVSKAGS
ncbi:MAG TPA: 30S ribosomal protein S17 [Candidatus Paceibacterota bacterium]|jgi:small subunit ribosomal protein S17|nr:30S ribosomal protein S17 [Candidatus Paceibacterota bacterium]